MREETRGEEILRLATGNSYTERELGRQLAAEELVNQARECMINLELTMRRYRAAAYDFERSFAENVKEISGTGWTAEEAKKRYGL